MTESRWEKIERLFHAATELPPGERSRYLDDACSNDPESRQKVELLLVQDALPESVFPASGFDVSAGVAISPGVRIERYEIINHVGSGGSGEVYLARDTQLGRNVALKLLSPGFNLLEDRLEHFQQEARTTSALNHPNIMTVYEFGSVEGIHFIASEFVEGRTLRAILSKETLPITTALDIAIQIAEALSASHRAGVIHRDVKPENIMVRNDGYVKVLDFGLARFPSIAGIAMGTKRYMSSEQARGLELDSRTDIFSFALVLREMTANQTAPAGLAPILEKALQEDRTQRYANADELLLDLQKLKLSIESPRNVLSRHWGWVAATTAVIIALAVGGSIYTSKPDVTGKDTILLAEFANTTGDPVFDETLKQALALQLEQTPYLSVFPDEAVRTALALMERSPDERLTRAIAREICQRQGLRIMIAGTIASLGTDYVITLEAINGQTGETIAREQAQAESKEKVLLALSKSATGLRQRLGESLNTLQKFNTPLEQATTSSLDAFKAYSVGNELFVRGNARGALPFFTRAVDLDPRFAAAYERLAWIHVNLADTAQAVDAASKAFSLQERVSEHERFIISDTYHHLATGDWEKQNDSAAIARQLYPNDWVWPHVLGLNHTFMGRDELAVEEEREAIRLNPNIAYPYRYLSMALVHLNRLDEAKQVIAQARSLKLETPVYKRMLYLIAFLQHDPAEMRRQLDLLKEQDADRGLREASLLEARTSVFYGRWREAQEAYRRFAQTSLTPEVIPRRASFGFCDPAEQASFLANMRVTNLVLIASLPDGSWCGPTAPAEKFVNEMESRYPNSTLTRGLAIPFDRAVIELAHNRPDKALASLEAVIPQASGNETNLAAFPLYVRGQAYLRLGRAAEAQSEFRKILDRPSMDILFPLAHLGLARAYALGGNTSASRGSYEDFFALWKDADPDLPVLIDAKKDYSRLQAPEGR